MAQQRSNNDTAMDNIRRDRASVECVKDVSSWNIKEIEAALSAAASASLRVIAEERPGYIALTLLGQDASGAELLNGPPTDLNAEIASLSSLLREAVNAAARRQDSKLKPLHHIAGESPTLDTGHTQRRNRTSQLTFSTRSPLLSVYLIEKDMEVPDSEPLPEDALTSFVAEEQAAAAQAAAAEGQAARRALAGVAAALAARGKPGKISAHVAKAAATPQSQEEKANADAKRQALLRRQKSQRAPRRNVPVLGRRASEVLPAVIGTFQDYASNRAARMVDENVVLRAEAVKTHEIKWSDVEDELTTEERALRAMGLGSAGPPPAGRGSVKSLRERSGP